MTTQDQPGGPIFRKRYGAFRDTSGSWAFEIREYHDDLNSIVPENIAPDPTPQEAYRAAVFLEGFIQEQRSAGNWSENVLDQFETFESPVEVEAVATALRELGGRAE